MSQPYNVIRASSLPGVVLDCVVNPALANVGKTASGGTATDNTAALNNALLSLSAVGAGSVKMILDGGSLTTGLTIPGVGNYEIEGIGRNSGIFMAPGSNSHAIYNNGKTAPFAPGPPAPALGGYVTLRNFTINGNRGNGTTGNSNSGDPRGLSAYWYSNIDLANLNAVRIEDVYSYDSPGFNMRLNNCADMVVENNTILNPNTTAGPNQDCIHIGGPANDVNLLNNKCNNNNSDDGIAINAPEGYGGNINRVVISGNTFLNTTTGARVYGSSTALVQQLIFANNNGDVHNAMLSLGGGSVTPQDISGQAISCVGNVFNIANGPFIGISSDVGDLNVSDCIWNGPETAFNQGFIVFAGTGITISALTLNNPHIYRSTGGNATNTPLLAQNGGTTTIKRMTINGFQVLDEAGQSYAAITAALAMTGITITELFIGSLDYTNIATLADSYTNIASISGPGFAPSSQVATKTAAYTVLPTDGLLLANLTTGAFAFTLPAKAYPGELHVFKKIDASANALTITGTVDGATKTLTTQYQTLRVQYDGTNWNSV